ncbi:MAG: 2-oxoglutarate dehydrogenase E1 component [Oligoflexales bacterium]
MHDPREHVPSIDGVWAQQMFEQWQQDPGSVPESWRHFFQGYQFAIGQGLVESHTSGAAATDGDAGKLNARVEAFINTYRRLGHLGAHLNPLSPAPTLPKDLQPDQHGLADVTASDVFQPANFVKDQMSFGGIHDHLKKTYCNRIGVDFRDLGDIQEVLWLQEKMENCANSPEVDLETQKSILEKLAAAEGFEKFLQARYLGQKRFSIEGLESLVCFLDTIVDHGASLGIQEVNLGMAHRGRLNVLANVLKKPLEKLLQEFEGSQFNPFDIDGDVKYHLGFASQRTTPSGDVRMFLSPNPSHLEAVNPVIEGFARCRQERLGDEDGRCVVPILLHGDAAFAGQGLVAETLNLASLQAYKTGGTIHVITNNQIGFTTLPPESCSYQYNSDISKALRAPVFHVNADDPEAVLWVAKIAVEWRQKFHKDVVVDLVGYRRHGHNETDEPAYTQPKMYQVIKKHPTVFKIYGESLVESGLLSKEDVQGYATNVKQNLQSAFEKIRQSPDQLPVMPIPESLAEIFEYRKVSQQEVFDAVETKVSEKNLRALGQHIATVPSGLKPHNKIVRLLDQRQKMFEKEGAVDWAMGELLAFATLLKEDYRVRLSGQDCQRGTFSSRHAVVFDQESGDPRSVFEGLGHISVINSPLSEQACLGFEFGYSIADKNSLVIWEAQFGDFANGAQIIIDQFLVASEAKWNLTCGLVLMLPHGHEGQGPEHSSARPERYLQSCGNRNIQVCNVTTPAQLFHLLRRQMLREFKKPLVLMTPKSLLRHPEAVSSLKDFTHENFREVLVTSSKKKQGDRVIACSGKIYYELLSYMNEAQIEDVSILRAEQVYPFPSDALRQSIDVKKVKDVIWVQEEPQNMGSWTFVEPRLKATFPELNIQYVGRKNSGTTAEGTSKAHQLEQERIIREAFSRACAWEPKKKKA